jgi:hypothetical protein
MKAMACTAQARLAAALLDPDQPCPTGLVAWNGSDPARRLAVYRNNVMHSLVDALAQTFPVVQELVGEAFFRAMAAVFVRQSPPRTQVLAFHGSELPAFIAQFAPAASVPYLADVARLELARVYAYHATDAAALSQDRLDQALAGGGSVEALRVDCHPSAHVIGSPFAVVSVWAAHQGVGDLADVDVGVAENALVVRDGHDVLVIAISRGAAEFVRALQRCACLAQSVDKAIEVDPLFDLSASLALLLRHGALANIHTQKRSHQP